MEKAKEYSVEVTLWDPPDRPARLGGRTDAIPRKQLEKSGEELIQQVIRALQDDRLLRRMRARPPRPLRPLEARRLPLGAARLLTASRLLRVEPSEMRHETESVASGADGVGSRRTDTPPRALAYRAPATRGRRSGGWSAAFRGRRELVLRSG